MWIIACNFFLMRPGIWTGITIPFLFLRQIILSLALSRILIMGLRLTGYPFLYLILRNLAVRKSINRFSNWILFPLFLTACNIPVRLWHLAVQYMILRLTMLLISIIIFTRSRTVVFYLGIAKS